MKAAAICFIAIEALAAFWLAAVTRHGPAGLGFCALAYLVAAPAATWWSLRRFQSRSLAQRGLILGATGLLMLALAPALLLSLDWLERTQRDRAIAATRVGEVRDEPILTSRGQEVGVRLSFDVEFSSRNEAAGILPALLPLNYAGEHLYIGPLRRQVDGRLYAAGKLEAGRHRLVVDLHPWIVGMDRQGGLCLSGAAPPLPAASRAEPLRIEISDTTYGFPWRGGKTETTRHAYDTAGMYRNVLAETLPACR